MNEMLVICHERNIHFTQGPLSGKFEGNVLSIAIINPSVRGCPIFKNCSFRLTYSADCTNNKHVHVFWS